MKFTRFTAYLLFVIIILFSGEQVMVAQGSKRSVRRVERKLAGGKRKSPREKKVKQPRAVMKAQKAQQKRDAKNEKDYKKSLKQNKKRHFSIQTEDVQNRMKQNEKETRTRDKDRKKREKRQARAPGSAKKKYRRNK
jgi:hypothetical protein